MSPQGRFCLVFCQDFPALVLFSTLAFTNIAVAILKLGVLLACLLRSSANANMWSEAAGFPELAPRSSKPKEACIIATAVHAF